MAEKIITMSTVEPYWLTALRAEHGERSPAHFRNMKILSWLCVYACAFLLIGVLILPMPSWRTGGFVGAAAIILVIAFFVGAWRHEKLERHRRARASMLYFALDPLVQKVEKWRHQVQAWNEDVEKYNTRRRAAEIEDDEEKRRALVTEEDRLWDTKPPESFLDA